MLFVSDDMRIVGLALKIRERNVPLSEAHRLGLPQTDTRRLAKAAMTVYPQQSGLDSSSLFWTLVLRTIGIAERILTTSKEEGDVILDTAIKNVRLSICRTQGIWRIYPI